VLMCHGVLVFSFALMYLWLCHLSPFYGRACCFFFILVDMPQTRLCAGVAVLVLVLFLKINWTKGFCLIFPKNEVVDVVML
jgi:hypothetical protein